MPPILSSRAHTGVWQFTVQSTYGSCEHGVSTAEGERGEAGPPPKRMPSHGHDYYVRTRIFVPESEDRTVSQSWDTIFIPPDKDGARVTPTQAMSALQIGFVIQNRVKKCPKCLKTVRLS